MNTKNPHWNTIIAEIWHLFEIEEYDDWIRDNKFRLKECHSVLGKKLKKITLDNNTIAEHYMSSTELKEFISLDSESKKIFIEECVRIKSVRLNIDIRTLETVLKGNKMPNERIKDSLAVYVSNQVFDMYSEEKRKSSRTKQSLHNISNDKIRVFEDTHWWIYYYHYDEVKRIGNIGRALLFVDSLNFVTLENVESETSTHYEGILELDTSNQHLSFDLKAVKTEEKHLRIVVFKGGGKVYPFLLGVYTNLYANNSMAAGSIMMEQIMNISEEVNNGPQVFSLKEARSKGIDPIIVDFLAKRENNFVKVPGSILTKSKFKIWRSKQKNK
jgi:hypothetical protein